jgi:hypothetical protein
MMGRMTPRIAPQSIMVTGPTTPQLSSRAPPSWRTLRVAIARHHGPNALKAPSTEPKPRSSHHTPMQRTSCSNSCAKRRTTVIPINLVSKAYLSQCMVAASQMLPALKGQVFDLIAPPAQAAAVSCSRLSNSVCGTKWYVGGWDGTKGLGQQLSALDKIQGPLIKDTQPPLIVPDSR